MHSDATSRLVDAVVRTRRILDAARRRTTEQFGEGPHYPGKSAVLADIRDLHDRIIRPIVETRQQIVRDVGAVWFQEDIGLVHEMPRAIVHFTSVDSAEEAPRAYMTIHVGEDSTTSVSENFLTPVKTTDVRTCRLDDLDSGTMALLIDRFLAKAIQG
ncbi:hypothetical protein TSH100_07375 [Azospirillum sp. TSH100]|uniref:hypothetical protein n=1 Tax=Azospirillum sp. TSH100 TaxID=652764 RepID=UPI000D61967B|nr:hypothetical protein [Azospirillum sp. TSH100]PWC88384.1 hypothetical protein TSH100_07375 [Azospirillum sp. TSH100]QCG90565.1 hypothetical protein E6C72_22485 [Azospirillum sp. TSH100]